MAKKKRQPGKRRRAGEGNPDRLADLPLLPDRRAMERILRQVVRDLDERDEAETPLSRAQEVMYEAFEARGAAQLRLARKALEISPDCADAYVLLAEHAGSLEEAQRLYEEGVAAGERALGKEAFEECRGHFWGYMETRPYMRARRGLAECLWQAGRREEAAEHYQEMLRLNPDDNQGVRYVLAACLLELDRDEDLRRLLEEYEDDASAEWGYSRALLAFRTEGDSPQARKLLAKATKENRHVVSYLLGHRPMPQESPPYITLGGEDEAASYAIGHRTAWLNTPGAISWLRKTLNVPLPGPSKRRKPAWPQLRLSLLRLPQDRDEVWEIDTREAPVEKDSEEGDVFRIAAILCRQGDRVGDLEMGDPQTTAGGVWESVLEVMRGPHHGEPRRPGKIQVQDRSLFKAWRLKLRQLQVECEFCERLAHLGDFLEHFDQEVVSRRERAKEEPPAGQVRPEDLLELPQVPGEVWQADARRMLAWIAGEGEPYRPWGALVADRTNDLILAHELGAEQPGADWLLQTIVGAIRRPLAGSPHRPGTVEVGSEEGCRSLKPYLDRAGIQCVACDRLEQVDFLFEDMSRHLEGPDAKPAMIDVPGVGAAQLGSFFAAAADYYGKKPWRHVPGDTPVKVECDKFQSGPWYAVVMGQSGVTQGLALYEDLNALQAMIADDAPDEGHPQRTTSLVIMFGEAFEIAVRDLDAAERHGWTVAGPEAYPLVLRVNPGGAVRPPLAWELEILEGCLRTVPAFLTQETGSASRTVPVASGEIALRLSWLR